ncbi:thioesterase domain-containing protein [Brevundimonas sp. SORGH_AS_0993]|uniref:thioesterase domain-containing protein n=1 Tax=Brevundimonas sp. SORGH_AS_0993 TaxID=3041794 RepID=UPI00278AB8CE|nr:thioesterase domain-containing protein [Brevundimonas sp. SORGH_AS_0993]MDQ1153777.1 thioesterase domain-containing protein [Brevundimonas sp. SORGH_AS_0993]
MTADALQTYLHDHIPLSHAMQVSVRAVTADALTLEAPLAPNINHRDTVFGGSASALAILSAWSLVHTKLATEGLKARLVIQSNTVHYDQPIAGTFQSTAILATPADWPRFLAMFRRRGKARITVAAILTENGQAAGRFEGSFVALAMDDAEVQSRA